MGAGGLLSHPEISEAVHGNTYTVRAGGEAADNAEVLALYRAEMLGEEGGDGSNQHTRATGNNITSSKRITGTSRAYSIDVVQRGCDAETVAEVLALYRAEMLGEEGGDKRSEGITNYNVMGDKAIQGNSRAYSMTGGEELVDDASRCGFLSPELTPTTWVTWHALPPSFLKPPTTRPTGRGESKHTNRTWRRSVMASRRRSWTTWPPTSPWPVRCSTTSWRL